MYFLPTLIVVLISLIYMLIGFLLGKTKKVTTDNLKVLSTILIYVCGPCMVINSFLNVDFDKQTALNMLYFFLVTFALQILFGLLMVFILRKHLSNNKVRVLCACSICGNVGFFGLPLIQALYPNEPIVMAYSSIFVMTMNIVIFTFGTYCITNEKKHISIKKALLNPTTIAMYISLPLFFLKINSNMLGEFSIIFSLLAKMTTPICMIMLGCRLAYANFKNLFNRSFVYIACIVKLIIFPLISYLIIYFIPFFDDVFKASIFVLTACPSAALVASIAELYQIEEENAANVVLFSTVICVITLPLLMLIL